ncbi:E3 ubiquitin-protein ligase Os03g0188200-like [Musa acuminata AAA Group]|uniref:E3 ubiquitin-protein ligase Os03g0188200-like n=1 Tax=Musa acuminata AAA Group TaxID=214697 RepID=UPI0031E1DE0E
MTVRLLSIAAQVTAAAAAVSAAMLLAGVGVLVVLHVCTVGKAFRRWSTATSARDRRGGPSHGLSPDRLKRLPCYAFGAGRDGTLDCAVCLESFRAGDRLRLLPACGHSFHAQCVDPWLLTAPVCPICRRRADGRSPGTASPNGPTHQAHVRFDVDPVS